MISIYKVDRVNVYNLGLFYKINISYFIIKMADQCIRFKLLLENIYSS